MSAMSAGGKDSERWLQSGSTFAIGLSFTTDGCKDSKGWS
jgi:hypothetical protein